MLVHVMFWWSGHRILWSERTRALTGPIGTKDNQAMTRPAASAASRLDPRVVALVRFMARCAATKDYAALLAAQGTASRLESDGHP